MFIVVTYDIVNDKRRTKLAKMLSDFGSRVQKSVFEFNITEKQYLDLQNLIDKKIDHEEDSVRYYVLCGKCLNNIQISGMGTVKEDENVIIV
ncbi:MAG: CRISPR-associated endonuclease Cas2 [Desulfobacterales bacterium]|nr:CRISPR-associated endonuclease Cas2 [Desulfobacterales bacterium]